MPFKGPHNIYTLASAENVARISDWDKLTTSISSGLDGVKSIADSAKADAGDSMALASTARRKAAELGSVTYGGEWLWVVVDAEDNVLGGFRTDGTWESYGPGGGGGGGNLKSVWPAVAYGSSSTTGADLDNPDEELWVRRLENSLGVTILNRGANGAQAEEITARQGGISITAEVSGGVIPSSGPVELHNLNIDPIRAGSISSYGVEIAGVRGTLSRPDGTRVFTRHANGDPVNVPGVVDIFSTEGEALRNNFHFIGIGGNNIALIESGEQTIDELCAWHVAQTSTLTPAKPGFIVWGVMDRGTPEGEGTPRGTIIRELEAFLAKTYGAAFINVRAYLASYRALDEAGVPPTPADDEAIAVGSIPPSLRYNQWSIHLSAAAHEIQAKLFERHITRNGLL